MRRFCPVFIGILNDLVVVLQRSIHVDSPPFGGTKMWVKQKRHTFKNI